MLDRGYVRAYQALVEEKLRARGMDPAVLLGRFSFADQRYRAAATTNENYRALQRKVSEQIAIGKRSGQDVSSMMEESLAFRKNIDG
jgi:seryl-tRNA synthetase